jgi:hypothetical protein
VSPLVDRYFRVPLVATGTAESLVPPGSRSTRMI